MYIIVGLGNPGREYHRTRHNVGFMALDALATREGLSYPKTGFRCVYGEHRLSGEKVIIAKPDTFMNNSGLAVVQLVNYFKPSLDHLIVIYDDIDLPCGAIRIRENGSAGTHNGMRSIIEQLGREDFIRIRIGIGKPEHDLINHVLSAPDDKDMALLNKAFINASEAIKLIVSGNIEEAQTRYNYKPPKKEKPPKAKAEGYSPAALSLIGTLHEAEQAHEVFFVNENTMLYEGLYRGEPLSEDFPYGMKDILDAEARLRRFAPFIGKMFPETGDGIIESPLHPCLRLKLALHGEKGPRFLFIKQDSELPIAGSVKARGGIYEVLKHTEDIAIENSLLVRNAEGELTGYEHLDEYREVFSRYTIEVGSTGNLGLSIGIMSAAIGYNVRVHMSADAKQWKKELLRSTGVDVIEYESDYSVAVEHGRKACKNDPTKHFIDDERSKELFFGYSVAALRLKAQLDEANIAVDRTHPLIVHIPCGVGGAPGGITFGLKAVFGENVHCFFIEPVNAPCMLAAFLKDECIPVTELGLSGRTEADGLAVGCASSLVHTAMKHLLDGEFTFDDSRLLPWLRLVNGTEGVFVEPSAASMLAGAVGFNSPAGQEYIRTHGIPYENASVILWATGGGLVPEAERKRLIKGR